MTRIVCMANSWRPGGRCVAGIDIQTGDWVRPVPAGQPAIPEGMTVIQGRLLEPLDLIEMDLDPPDLQTRFQKENRIMRSSRWSRVGRLSAKDVLEYCCDKHPILHQAGKVARPEFLERKPPSEWRSLELRHVQRITFDRDEHKQDRWNATFTAGSRTYTLSLTDPVANDRLARGYRLRGECLLTISLTEPIAAHERPELCYKLVAAVIPLAHEDAFSPTSNTGWARPNA